MALPGQIRRFLQLTGSVVDRSVRSGVPSAGNYNYHGFHAFCRDRSKGDLDQPVLPNAQQDPERQPPHLGSASATISNGGEPSKWMQVRISVREVELLQQRGISRVVVQALQ
jgi:hypothetical protein